MNYQKTKAILILVIVVSAIAGITYFITVSAYLPKLTSEITKKKNDELKLIPIMTAAKDIPIGSVIEAQDLTNAQIPAASIIDQNKVYFDTQSLIGSVTAVDIYKGEQIIKDKIATDVDFAPEDLKTLGQVPKRKFEASFRYVTVDIPKYNFVNDRVGPGSLVDVLLDKGQGRYDVVIAKIPVLDKVLVGDSTNQQNPNAQIKRPLPKPLLLSQNDQGVYPGTATQLMLQNNPAVEDTADYRVTFMISEKEQKRLFEAMTYGKIMLRKYVFPSQPASIVTFTSTEQAKVVRDGTELVKPVVANTQTNPANTNGIINPGLGNTTPAATDTPLRGN
ncbi:MAG: SAF domain-containing protein [Ignavibacteriales bacterium]